jgi:hypothetical protein
MAKDTSPRFRGRKDQVGPFTVESWYDRHTRSWTTTVARWEGGPDVRGGSDYCGTNEGARGYHQAAMEEAAKLAALVAPQPTFSPEELDVIHDAVIQYVENTEDDDTTPPARLGHAIRRYPAMVTSRVERVRRATRYPSRLP